MKTFIKATLLSAWSIIGLLATTQAQEFSKLTPKQIGDKITLEYAISGEAVGQQFTVSPFYSIDGGKSFLPLKSVKGNVGNNIPGGRNQIIVWDVLKDLKELDSDVVFKLEGVSKSVVPLQDDFRDVLFKLESLNRTPDGNVELILSITNNGPTRDLKMINGLITITDFNKRKYDAQKGKIAEVEGNERYSTPQRTIKKGENVKARFLFERVPAEVDRAMRLDIGIELITDETYGIDLKIGKLQFRDLPVSTVQTTGMRVEQTKKLQLASSPEHFTIRKVEVVDNNPPVIELISPANIPLVGKEATRGRPYAQSSIGMDDKRLRSLATGEELATTDEFTMVKAKVTDESGIYDVTVNGISTEPSKDGVFQVKVPLEIGRNEIVIRAVDLRQNSIEKKFFVLRKSPSGKVAKGDTEELDLVFDSPKTAPRYFALIMGANDYADDAITDLDNPIQDATKLYNVLVNRYTFDPSNVIFLKNPTREQMINAMDWLTRKVTKYDNLLVFYAGHGFWDKETDFGYWIPTDSKSNSTANWLANSQIKDYVAAIKSKHTLVIADACFGGSIFRSRKAFEEGSQSVKKAFDAPSRKAMTSGNLTEVPDRSVFLEQLVDKLNNNTKSYVTAEELFASIRNVVLSSSPVTPMYGDIKDAGDQGGDFIFVLK
ncbi:MAG: caspase family protein [Tenuifilum sp.]|uniref:caspase family protein n=2 Tax=Tenuifilum sp. TaxID=2760880 RepID=UPI001B3E2DA1|nr:caspase family protein [Bacteroidales bacterium]HOU74436.1 caspase family protein [Tenuifilum sp.]HQG71934.1 caspase family protein [Tenuifilum sp.]HQI89342.1 caspase family protein [Tenuifilum sp.]HRS43795.1 caspase family protein [Tenuifilum sp.]